MGISMECNTPYQVNDGRGVIQLEAALDKLTVVSLISGHIKGAYYLPGDMFALEHEHIEHLEPIR